MPYNLFEKRTPLITFACNFSLRLHVTFNFEERYVDVFDTLNVRNLSLTQLFIVVISLCNIV